MPCLVLILKLILIGLTIYLVLVCYNEFMAIREIETPQYVEIQYIIPARGQSGDSSVSATIPQRWYSQKTETLTYRVQNWMGQSGNVTLNLYSDPSLARLGTPITLLAQSGNAITRTVTYSPTNSVDLSTVPLVAVIDYPGGQAFTTARVLNVVGSSYFWHAVIHLLLMVFLSMIVAVLTILFVIYVW